MFSLDSLPIYLEYLTIWDEKAIIFVTVKFTVTSGFAIAKRKLYPAYRMKAQAVPGLSLSASFTQLIASELESDRVPNLSKFVTSLFIVINNTFLHKTAINLVILCILIGRNSA
ncbi:hypothetical protein WA1_08675 [Scytonema hofmannii PCC 7110]|uniref:Uncharacterized protein n=1 Tax=Scytonema hofmannii PCC 7110 TaxID=128403 RepID=A0A139WS12_9CYAN|nr:hypothetical protein [Scytonema hofmannii]KYC35222.1 hypothetical protein WA1_08675 [Scytonema hofmannii PCC 7110]